MRFSNPPKCQAFRQPVDQRGLHAAADISIQICNHASASMFLMSPYSCTYVLKIRTRIDV